MSKPIARAEIRLSNLHCNVGAFALFTSLEATFDKPLTGILGANSSGKSTLLRVLAGLYRPKQGAVLYNGQDIYLKNHLKKHIGYVSAEPFLYPHLTVLENLEWVATLNQVPKKNQTSRISALLKQAELQEYANVLFGHLSAGIKKRAMLICALTHEPHYLFLDEPCSDLDPIQRVWLWQFLKAKSNEHQIIFSSHHPQEILSICDALYELKKGQLYPYSKRDEFSEILLQPAPSVFQIPPKENEQC
jgi:ABC-2 type transport system ATP-binding protein